MMFKLARTHSYQDLPCTAIHFRPICLVHLLNSISLQIIVIEILLLLIEILINRMEYIPWHMLSRIREESGLSELHWFQLEWEHKDPDLLDPLKSYDNYDIQLIFEKKCWLIIFFTLIMIWWEVGQSKYDHRKQFHYECFCWTCAPFASVCARHLGFLSLFCLSQYELIWMVFFAKIEIYETQPTKSKKLFWQKS